MPELLRALREKDDSAQGLRRCLEAERQQRRAEALKALAARNELKEKAQQVEAELQSRIQTMEAEHEQFREEHTSQLVRVTEQLEDSRAHEADLVEKNEALAGELRSLLNHAELEVADTLALRARVDALTAEAADLQHLLQISDEAREGLVCELREQSLMLEKAREELRELHQIERSGRETGQAQYDRLNAQCESLTRQLQDRGRAADVLEERCKRLEEAIQAKGMESERQLNDADVRRKEAEVKTVKALEDANTLREELRMHSATDTKLKESIAALEALAQEHKTEEHRLRQELFRVQALADERELQIQSGKKRESQLAEQAATVEGRLDGSLSESTSRQEALYAARAQIQTLELELQGARESSTAVRTQAARSKEADSESHQEALKRKDDRTAQRDSDIRVLETSLAQAREEVRKMQDELVQRDQELQKKLGEFQQRTGEEALQKTQDLRQKEDEVRLQREGIDRLRAEHDVVTHRLSSEHTAAVHKLRAEHEAAVLGLRATLEANETGLQELRAQKQTLQESLSEARISEERARIEAAKAGGEVRAAEQAAAAAAAAAEAASASAEEARKASAHALADKGVATPGAATASLCGDTLWPASLWGPRRVAEDSARAAIRMYAESRILALQRRLLLQDGLHLWMAVTRSGSLRAQVEVAVADELWAATECRAREKGLAGVLTARFPDATFSTLKRLILEFRRRLSAFFMELLPADPVEAQMAMAGLLDSTRRSLGRVLHATLFLYQKLRTLVPTELHEAMEDPAGKLVPLPFYVMPYKSQSVLRQGADAVVRSAYGAPRGARTPKVPIECPANLKGSGDPRLTTWMAEHAAELEELLPLHSSSPTEVPHFLERLVRVRVQAVRAASGKAHRPSMPPGDAQLHDRLDVLLLDALTVYMSAWRLAGDKPAQDFKRGRGRRSSSTGALAAPPPERELRLGAYRA